MRVWLDNPNTKAMFATLPDLPDVKGLFESLKQPNEQLSAIFERMPKLPMFDLPPSLKEVLDSWQQSNERWASVSKQVEGTYVAVTAAIIKQAAEANKAVQAAYFSKTPSSTDKPLDQWTKEDLLAAAEKEQAEVERPTASIDRKRREAESRG